MREPVKWFGAKLGGGSGGWSRKKCRDSGIHAEERRVECRQEEEEEEGMSRNAVDGEEGEAETRQRKEANPGERFRSWNRGEEREKRRTSKIAATR